MNAARPDRTEAAEYYFTYINQVADGDICRIIDTQLPEALSVLGGVSDEQSLYRYAPDKWSIREVISHVNDAERVFVSRALWFARGFDTPLPSFDQNVAMSLANADQRSWRSHVEELQAVRSASSVLFRNLPEHAWERRGVASGNPFTVRALAYIVAGHLEHHFAILRRRYLPAL